MISGLPNTASAETPLQYAETKLGDPYVYAATGPNAFDCSGLTQWAYGQAGIKIPRTSQEQAKAGTSIPLSAAQPGDLLLFSYPGESGNPAPNNHVTMYVGPNKEIEAPHTGENVKYSGIDTAHLSKVVHITGNPVDINGNTTPTSTAGALAASGINPSTWPGTSMSSASWNLLDPLGIGSSVAGDVASSVVSSVLNAAGPLMLNGASLLVAGALIVAGFWRMTEPVRQQAKAAEAKAAPLVMGAL